MMMHDDQNDPLPPDLVASYHQPPETPRDAIWARIQAERTSAPAEPPVLPFPTRAVGRLRTPASRALAWVTGVAALLAVGVGVGRLIPLGGDPVPAGVVAGAGSAPDRTANVMGMAVRQYLSRTETLLVGVSAGDESSQFAGLARDLLGITRLLLDSESLTDPATRVLLEDLELLLAQLVVLPSTPNPDQERSLITAGMASQNLMDRLRNAIPSPLGSAPAVYGEL